jgi:hydroxyquinol 1,2-dioxygenase
MVLETNAEDLAQAVIGRMADCKNPRFKELMSSLVTHLHAFAREVKLTPDEWMTAIQFLTATGQKCDEKRQEFILLSDTLGLSMQVVGIAQAKAVAANPNAAAATPATEATVQGPFFCEGAPQLEMGADLKGQLPGAPTLYSGTITDLAGKPVADCILDVWSGDTEGFYDLQMGDNAPMQLRAQFRTGEDGKYHFWSIKPSKYPVPVDGPVGKMLLTMGRHPFRPGHMHMMLRKDGYATLVTHLFVSDSEYLHSDAVFGVRNSLIVDFADHAGGKTPDGWNMNVPWCSASYDFKLVALANG